METQTNSLPLVTNLNQHTDILNFIKDDRNIRMFIVFVNKKFTWDRELRGFGFSIRQIQYSKEFLINKGLIEVKNLEDLDIKIVEFISLSMPYGEINPNIQVLTITNKGLEWAQNIEPYININDYQPLLDKINNKIQIIQPFLNKIANEENTKLYRKIFSEGIEIETARGKELKYFISNFRKNYLEVLEGQKQLTYQQKNELMQIKNELVLYNKKQSQTNKEGLFYNNKRVSNEEFEELTRPVDVKDLEGGYIGIPIKNKIQESSTLQELVFNHGKNEDKEQDRECFKFLARLEENDQ